MSISLPSQPKIVFEEGNKSIFEINGLHPGYGQTLGNSIRRVLLSSLKGAALTSVKIEGAPHEFSTLEGVKEDVVEILLNLKQLRFRLHEEGPVVITLAVSGEKEVTGKDFQAPSQVEVINKDVHIATLTAKKARLHIEGTVESGLGYGVAEARSKERVEVGVIALDAAFSPVRQTNYEVENMRVGDRTDYNRLRLHVGTDGSLTPREAFRQAAAILVEQYNVLLSGFTEEVKETVAKRVKEAEEVSAVSGKEDGVADAVLKIKLDELKLSSRTLNVLREVGIKTVGGIVRKREEKLREVQGLGEKGMQEIKKAMGNFGITLKQ